MTLPMKSIVSCLVILIATASDIHAKQMRELGKPQKLAVSQGGTIILGNRVDSSRLPIIAYSVESDTLHVSVYIQPYKQCDFEFSGVTAMFVGFKSINQLTNDRIVFVWSVPPKRPDVTKVSIVDMKKCAKMNDIVFMWGSPPPNTVVVVPFVDGFDTIVSDNSRTSYDTNGNLVGEQKSFLIDTSDFAISAVSKNSRNNGFFIVDNTNRALNFINANGKIEKHLLDLGDVKVFSNNEQSMYSQCSFDIELGNVVYCFQYDEHGTQKWINHATLRFYGELDVKNLPGGGLAFAVLNLKGTKVTIVEMGPKQVKYWSYSLKQTFTRIRLMDFSEKDGTFVLAYQINQDKQGILEKSVVLQKYSLIS